MKIDIASDYVRLGLAEMKGYRIQEQCLIASRDITSFIVIYIRMWSVRVLEL